MAFLSFEFFFRLVWGWSFFMLFISRAESSEDFLRVSFRFIAGFFGIAALSALYGALSFYELGVCGLIFLASWAYLSRSFVILRILGVLTIAFAPLLLFWSRPSFSTLNFILAAWVLGGAFVGQFLGHWYLNVPNIHIREFKRIVHMAMLALGLRSIWILFMFYERSLQTGRFWEGEFFSLEGGVWLSLGYFGIILLITRILWGLVAPLILTYMAKKTVDMRATQSATGIFYANSVLVLLGELTALYMERELNWPI
jgi:hypothetical protein